MDFFEIRVNSEYLLFLLTGVLGERSEDGSYNHIQFEKRRWHLVWLPRGGEACLLVRNSFACKSEIEISYLSLSLSFYMACGVHMKYDCILPMLHMIIRLDTFLGVSF